MRIKILIGIAALLALAAGARLVFPGSEPDGPEDPVVKKVNELAAAEDVAGLAEQVSSGKKAVCEVKSWQRRSPAGIRNPQ